MIALNGTKSVRPDKYCIEKLTFITTFKPWSAKIAGENSDPLYASRLYRALVANKAIAGGPPIINVRMSKFKYEEMRGHHKLS